MENKADAMLFLQEAIDENPNDELAFLNRATICEQENDYKSAIKDITSAISLTPNISAYYWWRALDYFKLEDYQKTLNDLNTCLSISEKEDDEEDKVKNNAYFYELRAYTNYELKNISSAREDCQTAYRLSNEEELNKRLENFWQLLW
jgi:tetratricopeptide (TPR) repeat protein